MSLPESRTDFIFCLIGERWGFAGCGLTLLLYVILLLHDIGKSEGIQGHAETGVTVAAPVLARLGASPDIEAPAHARQQLSYR